MKIFAFILFLLFSFSCKTNQKKPELVYGSNKFAIHKVQLVPEDKRFFIFPEEFSHPVRISNKKVVGFLAELSYSQFTEISNYKQKVFLENEINEIANVLPSIMQNLSNKSFLLVIMRVKPNQTVASNYQITRFLVWQSGKRLNLFFDKIREPMICRKCALEPMYWASPRFNFENEVFGKSFIQKTQMISYKSNGTLNNRKWITIDLAEIKEKINSTEKKTSKMEEETLDTELVEEETFNTESEEEIKKLPPVPSPFDEEQPQEEEKNNLTESTLIIRHEE